MRLNTDFHCLVSAKPQFIWPRHHPSSHHPVIPSPPPVPSQPPLAATAFSCLARRKGVESPAENVVPGEAIFEGSAILKDRRALIQLPIRRETDPRIRIQTWVPPEMQHARVF